MAAMTSVRMMLSIACHQHLPVHHADVPQAFLRALLGEELYIRGSAITPAP